MALLPGVAEEEREKRKRAMVSSTGTLDQGTRPGKKKKGKKKAARIAKCTTLGLGRLGAGRGGKKKKKSDTGQSRPLSIVR